MDFGFAIPNDSNSNSNQHHVDYKYEIRLDEYILQGMEDILVANVNEDNIKQEMFLMLTLVMIKMMIMVLLIQKNLSFHCQQLLGKSNDQ